MPTNHSHNRWQQAASLVQALCLLAILLYAAFKIATGGFAWMEHTWLVPPWVKWAILPAALLGASALLKLPGRTCTRRDSPACRKKGWIFSPGWHRETNSVSGGTTLYCPACWAANQPLRAKRTQHDASHAATLRSQSQCYQPLSPAEMQLLVSLVQRLRNPRADPDALNATQTLLTRCGPNIPSNLLQSIFHLTTSGYTGEAEFTYETEDQDGTYRLIHTGKMVPAHISTHYLADMASKFLEMQSARDRSPQRGS